MVRVACCFKYDQNGLVTIKYNKEQLKLFFFRDSDGINEHQDFTEDEIDQSGVDCMESPVNDIIQNNQPLDENPVENSQFPDEEPIIAIINNAFDKRKFLG